jgi:hypothetical protein
MELMQCLAPHGTPLVLLVQQGAEIAGQISTAVPWVELTKRSTTNALQAPPNVSRSRSVGRDHFEQTLVVAPFLGHQPE